MTQNSALKPLEILVGTWSTEGSHGLLPGITLRGTTSCEWIEGGAFLLMRSEISNDARFPKGIAIIGSDNEQNRFTMLSFDERDVSRLSTVTVEGNVVRWWRDHPGFSQRCVNTVSPDGSTLVSKGELCRDGVTWEKDLEMTYTRIQVTQGS